MKIAFACPHCGSRLVAEASLAGRNGRCRHCGRRVVVPDGQPAGVHPPRAAAKGAPPRAAANASRKPASTAPAAAPAAVAPAPDADGGYRLRPVTPKQVPALEIPGWDDEDFEIVIPPQPAAPPPRPLSHEPSPLFRAYRAIFSQLTRATTWISETSYAVSLVLLMLSVAAGMIGHHGFASVGVKAIVALNLVGLAGDLVSLVNLSFRRDPLRGALFLVPPLTLYFLWSDWRRYRDTVGRMRIPLMTLALVGTAYLFVPWLSGGTENEGSIVTTAERVVGTLEERLGGRRGTVEEALKNARSWLREGAPPEASPAADPPPDDRSPPPAPGEGS